MKIFLLGAAGNAGQRILRAALARAHEVTAMVRDEAKLPSSPNLRVTRGIVDKSPDLARVMVGHDVVINAAGNVAEASAFTKLVQTVIDATTASLGEDGRLWVFGGAALLTVPGTRLMAVDLPGTASSGHQGQARRSASGCSRWVRGSGACGRESRRPAHWRPL